MDKNSSLLFRVDTFLLSISVAEVSSVRPLPCKVTPTSLSPEYVIGMYVLEGENITLIDTGRLLGFKAVESLDTESNLFVIILHGGIGLLVKEVIGVDSLSEYNLSFPSLLPPKAVRNLFWSNNLHEMVFELDISKLL